MLGGRLIGSSPGSLAWQNLRIEPSSSMDVPDAYQFGGFLRVSRTHELMRPNGRFGLHSRSDGHGPQDRGGARRTYEPALQGADAARIGQYVRRGLRLPASGEHLAGGGQ